ncbi:GNAT family N-acetyltransferase [Pricia sp. S334]|uniref:GNAT family N-acetyltransferase n=1 Tax=Pricia mediterranea TaxID=3076079 RepID=A0ABU3L664_9FLAO|nr:GNAT family N-acetyltransferase [Pricia sp. S334]MDT7829162.1 GNAT family N-acetyltransferase [Pricia sp. S334]
MIQFGRATSEADLNQILDLQRQNLPEHLSAEERVKEGFVTVSHTLNLLKVMHDVCPHIVAKSNESVIGYALSMHPKFAGKIEVLWPMFDQIEAIRPKVRNYIVMGQICIAKAYRGQGIFRQLYQTMQAAVQPEFERIITEVDVVNTRSLGAHYGVGFEDLATYESGGHQWKLIVL